MRSVAARCAAAALTALSGACAGDGGRASWDGEVRDSAGLSIIENAGLGLWTPETAWRIEPAFELRDRAGAEDDIGLISGFAVDGRGRIIVIDLQARNAIVFDSAGGFAHTVGRPGQGPGEFSRFLTTAMIGSGDSILIPDWAQARLSVFSPDGRFARQIVTEPEPQPQSWVRLEDGYLYRGITIGRDERNHWTTWDALLRANADFSTVDTLIVFDYPRSDLGGPGRSLVPLIVNVPMWTRLNDGRIAWSSLDLREIRIHDSNGREQARLRHAAWTGRTVTDGDRSALREKLRERFVLLGVEPTIIDNLELTFDEILPALTAVQAGPRGTIWVQRMGAVEAVDPMVLNTNDASNGLGGPDWDVFDAEGRFLGTLTLPAGVRIELITDRSIWGVRRDADGVQIVQRLDIVIPEPMPEGGR
jgi:hypothetical protein